MNFKSKTKHTRSEGTLEDAKNRVNELEEQYATSEERNQFLLRGLGKLRSELVQRDDLQQNFKTRLVNFIDKTFTDYHENY